MKTCERCGVEFDDDHNARLVCDNCLENWGKLTQVKLI